MRGAVVVVMVVAGVLLAQTLSVVDKEIPHSHYDWVATELWENRW